MKPQSGKKDRGPVSSYMKNQPEERGPANSSTHSCGGDYVKERKSIFAGQSVFAIATAARQFVVPASRNMEEHFEEPRSMNETAVQDIPKFDYIVHLTGEQPLPLYIGLRQFDCRHHIMIVTEKTAPVVDAIGRILPDEIRWEKYEVEPYDAKQTELALGALRSRLSGSVAFNLTGGTKPMFAAALRVALSVDCPAFYVETGNKSLIWLNGNVAKQTLRPAVDQVSHFIGLAGFSFNSDFVNSLGAAALEREEILTACWKSRGVLEKSYRQLSEYSRYAGVPFRHGMEGHGLFVELKGPPGYEGVLQIANKLYRNKPWMDLAAFVVGGWFEEFVYLKMQALVPKGLIKDALLRVKPVRLSDGADANPVQEFDIAFADGYHFTIVECKAGVVEQEHIQKLENLARRFGGHFGRGVLVVADPLKVDKTAMQRIRESDLLCAISCDALLQDPELIVRAKGRTLSGFKTGQQVPKGNHRR